jgi:hypothetical protein
LRATFASLASTQPRDASIIDCGASHCALNAATVASRVPPATVTILDAAHRIVRVNLTKLDFGQDYSGQSAKDLVHAFAV